MSGYRIKARYSEKALIPDNALPGGCVNGTRLETSDGVSCVAHFLCTWDNSDGRYDTELDGLCHRQWGVDFSLLRSAWIGRIDNIGVFWHYIELIKDN